MNNKIKDLDPGWAYDNHLPFTPGRLVDGKIYVAGCVALDANGNQVGIGDIKAQTRQVFENIRAILALEGADLDDIVTINVYLTSRDYYRGQIEVRKEMFKRFPAATVVVVQSLGRPDWLIEVEAMAVKP